MSKNTGPILLGNEIPAAEDPHKFIFNWEIEERREEKFWMLHA